MKRTPWFDGSVTPVHVGTYECEWLDNDMAARWFNIFDGKRWYWGKDVSQRCNMEQAIRPDDRLTLIRWRGLTKPHK